MCLSISHDSANWGHYTPLKVTWQMKHKHFKNPTWWEAYQLAIYKCDRHASLAISIY